MADKIKITFLGTSASIPTTKRNHSAILLNYKEENILIDCGEGTQRQFRKARINPGKVSKILITHWHGDHTFGIPGLLSTLNLSEYNKKMQLFGPKGTKKFMKDFVGLVIPNFKFEMKIEESEGRKIFFENEEFYLESMSVKHGPNTNAYSFVIKDKIRIDKKKLLKSKISPGKHLADLQKGKDITFEGKKYKAKDLTYVEKGKKVTIILDTVYFKELENFSKGADFLVCESSFGDNEEGQAREHMHLTSGQAGKIAKAAKAKKLILTHISQRYETNLKELRDCAKKNFKDVTIVKDLDSFVL